MNRFKALGSALLFVPALALVSTQARAEFKCATPETPFDRTACEKAAEGPDALRQYVQRMQPIANLYFFDYVNEAQAVAWAQNNANRPAGKAAVQTATVLQAAPGA